MSWQPIKTCNTCYEHEALVYDPDQGIWTASRIDDIRWISGTVHLVPTHWMPLPEPPQPDKEVVFVVTFKTHAASPVGALRDYIKERLAGSAFGHSMEIRVEAKPTEEELEKLDALGVPEDFRKGTRFDKAPVGGHRARPEEIEAALPVGEANVVDVDPALVESQWAKYAPYVKTKGPMPDKVFEAKDGDKFALGMDWWRVGIDLDSANPKYNCGFYIPQDLLKPIGEWLIAASERDLNPNTNGALERMGLADKFEVVGLIGEKRP